MTELSCVVVRVPLEVLKREQPALHRELCDGIGKLYAAKNAIHRLKQAYVIDGALAEVLQLVDDAMAEVQTSLRGADTLLK